MVDEVATEFWFLCRRMACLLFFFDPPELISLCGFLFHGEISVIATDPVMPRVNKRCDGPIMILNIVAK